MSDTPIKSELSSLKNEITNLASEIDIARGEITNGKIVDLSNFLIKVNVFCNSVSTNLPAEKDAETILASIEALLQNLNELQHELTELEATDTNKPDVMGKNGDVT